MTLTDNSLVTATQNHISTDVDGERVILHPETAQYHGLADVAATIWETIQQPTTVGAIHEQLVATYDVDAETCHRDLLGFIDELVDARLATVE